LVLIAEPELGGRSWQRLCDVFLGNPGDGRVRNDAADCADADECDPDCNNKSNGAVAHDGFHMLWLVRCERHLRHVTTPLSAFGRDRPIAVIFAAKVRYCCDDRHKNAGSTWHRHHAGMNASDALQRNFACSRSSKPAHATAIKRALANRASL
jgi:hypothetical protein